MRLILLTRAMEPSAEVLPALGLLAHHVRTMPAEATALLNAPACDALLVDGRRDLPAVRGLTRLLRQTGVDVPLILVSTEGGLAAIQWDWGMDDVIVDTSSPAEVEARLRLAIGRVQDAGGTPSSSRRRSAAASCTSTRAPTRPSSAAARSTSPSRSSSC